MPKNDDNYIHSYSPSLGSAIPLGRKWGAIYALHTAIKEQLTKGLSYTIEGTEFTLVHVNENFDYAAIPYEKNKLPIVISGGINNIVMSPTSVAPHHAGEHYIVGTDWWIKTDTGHYTPETTSKSRITPLQAAQLAEAALRSLRSVNISMYRSTDLIYHPEYKNEPSKRNITSYLLKPIELYAPDIYPDPHIFASYEFDVVDDEFYEGLCGKVIITNTKNNGE